MLQVHLIRHLPVFLLSACSGGFRVGCGVGRGSGSFSWQGKFSACMIKKKNSFFIHSAQFPQLIHKVDPEDVAC
jgi:hypothetical protein